MSRKLVSKSLKGTSFTDSDFHNPDMLGAEVEAVFGAGGLTWMESCIEVADAKGIEVEVLGKMLPRTIKGKILAEVSAARLLKPQFRIPTLF
jgi:hypothetical protein